MKGIMAMDWYFKAMQQYGVFTGRAQRAEYWVFSLVNAIVAAVLGLLEQEYRLFPGEEQSVLVVMYALVVLVPTLAVTARRLHDTSRSGWWMLICLVPLVGPIVLLVFAVEDSHNANQYGPNPKAARV